MQGEPVLEVEGLKTHFFAKGGTVPAVDDVSFTVRRGEIMGLVGESGSGKSVTGFSIMGLVDHPGRIVAGSIRLNGRDITRLDPAGWRKVRGKEVAMIFQDPMMTLNPVLSIATQMIEAVQAHEDIGRQDARARAVEALDKVGIPRPEERLDAYPHQFSGGMRQRVSIATALLNRPHVIIADEPTTALDVTIQAQILFEVQKLARETGTAIVWITHDLAVVSGLADTIAVMYAGKIVEQGSIDAVLDEPRHPYTVGLINSVPSQNERGKPLTQIPGMTPSLSSLPKGCSFRPRCPRASERCKEPPQLVEVNGALARCFHPHLPAEVAA